MRAYDALSGRGQLGRLRRMGRTALDRYPGDLGGARLVLLRHEQNATFRVDRGERYVLRINRPGLQSEATVESEMAWLAALRRDTDLVVPEPVATRDGSLVVTVADPGVPGARCCALLRWIDGRFVNRRLTPAHLARMGDDHGPAPGPRGGVDAARRVHPAAPRHADRGGEAREPGRSSAPPPASIPAVEDGERAVALVEDLLSPSEGAVAARAVAAAREATSALAARPGSSGLIHGDLHHENTLFTGDVAAAIDFDDCGWGFHLYDIAVPLSELTERRRFTAMRGAFLEAYARHRPLPDDAERLIDALIAFRGLQLITWILESREHAAFRDGWAEWAARRHGLARGQGRPARLRTTGDEPGCRARP